MTRRIFVSLFVAAVFPLLALAVERKAVRVDVSYSDGSTESFPATNPAPVTQPAPRPEPSLVGVNLSTNNDWNREYAFADLRRQFRKWGSTTKPYGGSDVSVAIDADGWPVEDFGVRCFTDQEEFAGTYTLSFTGKATTIRAYGSGASVKNLAHDADANKSTADVVIPVRSNLYSLDLVFIGTENGLRDVSLIRPGYASTQPARAPPIFTTEFVESLKPFGFIRFMDWMGTNNSTVARWEDRPTRANPSYAWNHRATGGVALEDCVELGNLARKDIWICIPDMADADFVRRSIAYVRANLDPALVCYVERSNETWNYIFDQADRDLAGAIADKANGIDYGSSNLDHMRWRRQARITVEIAQIIGDDPRFRVILASHVGYGMADQPKSQLEYIAQRFGPPSKFIYAIAGAPYLSLGKDPAGQHYATRPDLTADFIIDRLSGRLNSAAGEQTLGYHAVAREYGVRSIGYELGVDFGVSTASSAAKLAATEDPRMEGIVYDYLMNWRRGGGDQLAIFAHAAKHGPKTFWGFKPDSRTPTSQPSASKYRGAGRVASELSTNRN